jgi:uncharacterized repeat protein (TIGR03803 family)
VKSQERFRSLKLARSLSAIVVITAGVALAALAQTETVLNNFTGHNAGGTPFSNLVMDSAGNLYGTTFYGGFNSYGTVFKLSRNADGTWHESLLHLFQGGRDSGNPWAGLTMDASGNLYGTTTGGILAGFGSVFKLTADPNGGWHETVLHTFTGKRDGGSPYGPVILDAAGNIYGMTHNGGNANSGVVFELSPVSGGSWHETILHNFTGGLDGGFPEDGLAFDSAGNLYGTASAGGTSFNCGGGCGVAFKLSPTTSGTWHETVLHDFALGADGGLPGSHFVLDAKGNLYSTTPLGGQVNTLFCGGAGCGIVYELSPQANGTWKQTVLHSFTGTTDGDEPAEGGVTLDSAGNLYGTTALGGNLNDCPGVGCGVVYKLSPAGDGTWNETVLYNFTEGNDGGGPFSAPILDSAGNLYGTTDGGGIYGYGVVWEVTP